MAGASVLLASGLAAGVAHAGVEWQAPAECGSAATLTEKIAAQLGHPAADHQLAGQVAIAAGVGGYRATLDVAGAPRTLTGATCGEIVDAAALIFALSIRDAAPPEQPPATSSASTPELRLAIGARLAGDASTLPGAAIGGGPVIGLGVGRWSARAGAALWTGRTAQPGTALATEVGLISGDLALCARVGPGEACAIGAAGPMTGRGFDDAGGGEATRWWSAAGIGVGAGRSLGARWRAEVALEALAGLARPRFVFDDGRLGYRAPAVTVRLAIAVSATIFGGP